MIHFYLKRHFILILLLCLLFVNFLKAQEDCATVLSKAQKQYDAGAIEQIPKMLQSCIENGFTKEEKSQAFKLIIMSYLFDNNNKMAEAAMLDFLRRYPEYEILPSDQAEFSQLFNSYRTLPIATFGVILGTNISNIIVSRLYMDPKIKGTYSTSGFTYQAGFSFKRYIFNKMDFNIEAIFFQSSYQYSSDSVAAGNRLVFNETQNRIEMPLTVIYFPYVWNKFTPYVRGGISFGYLLNSSATFTRTEPGILKPFTDPAFSITDKRSNFQLMAVIGMGISYSLKRSNLFLDIRYNLGFLNQVNPDERYNTNNLDPYLKYYYVDNDFRMNNLCFSIGYNYKFYKPEKR